MPDNQTAREAIDAFPFSPSDHVQHPSACFTAKVDEVHVNTCERRPRRTGNDFPIVKADKGNRLRDTDAHFPQCIGDAARYLIIAADGAIAIAVDPETPATFTLHLRIPGWCRNAALSVNGEAVDLASVTQKGYAAVTREWNAGDQVRLDLDMAVERVHAHPEVRQDTGRIALMRGPVVYCLEETDNPINLNRLHIPEQAQFDSSFEPDLLGGVVTLLANVQADATADWAGALYRTEPAKAEPAPIKAIPYFAWDNRGPGEMLVWLRSG